MGKKGRILLIRRGKTLPLQGKARLTVRAGDRIRIETSGGGGGMAGNRFPWYLVLNSAIRCALNIQ